MYNTVSIFCETMAYPVLVRLLMRKNKKEARELTKAEKNRAYQKEYRRKNKEKLAEKNRPYQKEYQKQYYLKNKEKLAEQRILL